MQLDYFNAGERAGQGRLAALRDKVMGPGLGVLARAGLRPNHLTAASIASLLAGVAAASSNPLWYWVGVFFYIVLDGIDGPLARVSGTSSDIGAINDITADQFGVPIVLALAAYEGLVEGWVAALLAGVYIIVVYNLLLYNIFQARRAFTLRLKYLIFLATGLGLTDAFGITQILNPLFQLLAAYYVLALFLNMILASGKRRADQ